MSAIYGDLHSGRIIQSTKVESGAIVATLSKDDEGPEESAIVRQPLGLRARPRKKRGNTITSQDGDYPEVLLCWDPKLSLPDIAEGATQLHSVGDSPQMVEVADSKIKLGKDAQEAVVKGDTYRSAEDTWFSAIANICKAAGISIEKAGDDPTLLATAKAAALALKAGGATLQTLSTRLDAFNNNKDKYLSTLVKTE